jgi:hypothetical protein
MEMVRHSQGEAKNLHAQSRIALERGLNECNTGNQTETSFQQIALVVQMDTAYCQTIVIDEDRSRARPRRGIFALNARTIYRLDKLLVLLGYGSSLFNTIIHYGSTCT